MLDRRTFVLRTAAGIGGTLALSITAIGATAATARYRRVSLRWTGHRLVRVADAEPRHGDFTGFAQVQSAVITGPIDLFQVELPPLDDDRDYVLTPLGRVADLAAGRRAILAT